MTRICDPTSTDTAQQQIQSSSRSSSNASAVDGGREAASHHGSGNAGGAAKYGGLPASHAGEDRTPAGGQPGSVLDIEDGFRHVIFDSGIHVQTSRPLEASIPAGFYSDLLIHPNPPAVSLLGAFRLCAASQHFTPNHPCFGVVGGLSV